MRRFVILVTVMRSITFNLTLVFICRPPIKDVVIALASLLEALFYLFLHFLLLVYNSDSYHRILQINMFSVFFVQLGNVFAIFNFLW